MHPAAWPQWSRSCGNFRCLESLVADEGRFWTICHRGTAVHAKLGIQKLNGWAIPTRPSDGSLQMVRPAAWSGFEFCCCHWPTHSGIQQRAHGSRSDFTARKGAHQAVCPPSPGIHPASGVPVAKFQGCWVRSLFENLGKPRPLTRHKADSFWCQSLVDKHLVWTPAKSYYC